MKKYLLITMAILVFTVPLLYQQEAEASSLPPVTVRRTVILILLNLTNAPHLVDEDFPLPAFYQPEPSESQPFIDDRVLYIFVDGDLDLARSLNRVVETVDAAISFLDIDAIINEIQVALDAEGLPNFYEESKEAILEVLKSLEPVKQLSKATGLSLDDTASALYKPYMLSADPESIDFDMEDIVTNAIALIDDSDIQDYLGVSGGEWNKDAVSGLTYFAHVAFLLNNYRPWELKAYGHATIYNYQQVFAAATGETDTLEFAKELAKVNIELESAVETYLNTELDITDPRDAGDISTWTNRVFSLLHQANYDPAEESYEQKITYGEAKEAVKAMLNAGPKLRQAIKESWDIDINLASSRSRLTLDNWASLVLNLRLVGIEPATAVKEIESLIRDGTIGGVDFKSAVASFFKELYGIEFDPGSDLSNKIYFGWATNLATIFEKNEVFGNTEGDLGQAAQTTVDLMNNLVKNDKKLLKMASKYLFPGSAYEGETIDMREGWQAGVATYWGMVYTALVKKGTNTDKAYEIVQDELNVRRQIWDKVDEIAPSPFSMNRINSAMIETEGGYWLAVMTGLEQMLDYGNGSTSRDQSLGIILKEIENLIWDSDLEKFTNYNEIIGRIAEQVGEPVQLLDYIAQTPLEQLAVTDFQGSSTSFVPPIIGNSSTANFGFGGNLW